MDKEMAKLELQKAIAQARETSLGDLGVLLVLQVSINEISAQMLGVGRGAGER
jgi:hypothetical protein